MPSSEVSARRRRPLIWSVVGLVLVLVLLVAVLSILRPAPGPDHDEPTSASPTGGTASPLRVEETVPLTVPESVRTTTQRFSVERGASYLLRFEVSTVKPGDTPGTAMYLGVSLACSGGGDGEARKINGTQNILDDVPVTLVNQFLLTADSSGERACNVLISSPNKTAAAVGSRVDVDVVWEMTPVDDGATSFPSADRLPLVVPVDGRQAAFRETLTVPEDPGTRLAIYSSLHVTTCTIVNGSREGGQPLCTADDTDEGGSTFDTDLRVDVLDANGKVCQRLPIFDDGTHVDRKTHHQLLSYSKTDELPDDLCGDTLEFVLAVSNDGPAPLLIHGGSSSFIVVPEHA